MGRAFFITVLTALTLGVSADRLYTKSSPVIQVDAKNYDSLIAKSNHTSIVEFYAPWCGHCQNLKPAYEKAAKNLAGLAKVAAVNCDEDYNKQFCGSMGVKGFPTLKIVRPSAKSGKPVVEDYQGPRTAKGIVDAVVEKIPNHVKKVNDKNLEEWLSQGNDTAKAILFTEKGTTSALLRALAVDFLSSISFAQVRNKESAAIETFGVTSYPTFIILPGGEKESIVYDGELKKEPMIAFLSQVAAPNPDPAPKAAKTSASKKDKPPKASESASSSFSKASAAQKSSEASEAAASATKISLEDESPTESPNPIVEDEQIPIQIPDMPPSLPTIESADALADACLGEKTGTCVLALLPPQSDPEAAPSDAATAAIFSLAELVDKHNKRKGHLFPISSIPGSNERASTLRRELGLSESDVEIIAINGRRGWWRRYGQTEYGVTEVENWIDAIRLGEGAKQKIPVGLIVAKAPTGEADHDEL